MAAMASAFSSMNGRQQSDLLSRARKVVDVGLLALVTGGRADDSFATAYVTKLKEKCQRVLSMYHICKFLWL